MALSFRVRINQFLHSFFSLLINSLLTHNITIVTHHNPLHNSTLFYTTTQSFTQTPQSFRQHDNDAYDNMTMMHMTRYDNMTMMHMTRYDNRHTMNRHTMPQSCISQQCTSQPHIYQYITTITTPYITIHHNNTNRVT